MRVRIALFLFAVISASGAGARSVPEKSIPPSVMLEVNVVESQFNTALADDCAPDRCYSKGCSYQDHITLDQPRTTSLPGLPAEQGPGSVAPQDYLTRVRCGFSHEKNVDAADVQKLANRLRRRLSHGWLTVSVVPQALEPIPKSLSESAPDEPEEDPDAADEEPLPPQELTAELALQQFWNEILPHVWWMALILFATFALLVLIWAARRLGAPSLEDKMLEAQLANGGPPADPDEQAAAAEAAAAEAEAVQREQQELDEDFADEQERVWNDRLEKMPPEEDGIIARLLREWLKAGDYPRLARALIVFGDRVSRAFEDTPELAVKKVEFASYFREVDEGTLPSRAKFFRDLNQQAMASMLLSQDDVQLYRSLREDFGASGYVSLMNDLPSRYGALLFALIGEQEQQEVAALLPDDVRNAAARELLMSTRMAMSESRYLMSCVEAVREGQDLPAPPAVTAREHGPAVDSAGALSALLSHVSSADRQALFAEALRKNAGAAPQWYENIVFNHMLTALPDETKNDLLLEVDIRGLAAWLLTQPTGWRQAFVGELSDALQRAIRQNTAAFTSGDIARWARRGREGLVKAFQTTYARRGIKFVDLVA